MTLSTSLKENPSVFPSLLQGPTPLLCVLQPSHQRLKNAEISLRDLSMVFPSQFLLSKEALKVLALSALISPFFAQQSMHCVRICLEGDTNRRCSIGKKGKSLPIHCNRRHKRYS